MLVVLDDRQGPLAFGQPLAVIRADRPAEVPGALAAMEEAVKGGRWLAGWLAYELGHALEPRLSGRDEAPQPLLRMGVFEGPGPRPESSRRAHAGPLTPEWNLARYGHAFAAIKQLIAAGDIYQANLSLRAAFAFAGDALALYERLRRAGGAPHCAYVDDGERQILSLSPELFFDLGADGRLTARPMKGTAALEAGRHALAATKERAENLMIVDLIRNDLGRIAETGSVAVPALFAVETYPTLHTMVSTVTAQKRQNAGPAEILRALFPCGSVTGAPKIRAMEILRDLEASPRAAYCGAVGFFAPDGAARFNVAIRTLTIAGGRGELGIGGGVVQDSDCAAEYAECLLKARFFTESRRPIQLIETLKYDRAFVRLDRHLARMTASAQDLGLTFGPAAARVALNKAVAGTQGPQRVRLTLDEAGNHRGETFPLAPNPPHWTYALSPQRVDSGDALLRHKTDWRELFEQEAARHTAGEVIFRNERGELTEGARSNIFIRRKDRLLTPALACGLLPGCLRAELLDAGACEEAILREADLDGEVLLGNSLRGLIPAKPL